MDVLQVVVPLLVVAARLLVPLAIPRFPLPGLLAALVLDAVDQTVFAAVDAEPANYQSYDKALDVYYLAVTYASTLRNWTDPWAFRVGRFLWYYRLIGVVAFELTGVRFLLLVFPNTFEYFVLAYEAVRTRWNPVRLGRDAVIGLAAGIWVGVKLPQEYWIHVAQLDVTDEIAARDWVLPAAGVLALVAALAVAVLWRRLPPGDWRATVDVDTHRPAADVSDPSPASVRSLPFWSSVAEKALLLGLITVIFAQVLPVQATSVQIVVGTALFVAVNGSLSQVLARRGTSWSSTAAQFGAMAAVNAGVVGFFTLLRGRVDADTDPAITLFFVLLLSLFIALYDRYRTMRERRIRRLPVPWRAITRAPAS